MEWGGVGWGEAGWARHDKILTCPLRGDSAKFDSESILVLTVIFDCVVVTA